jgi:hypothetical protein
MAFFSYDYGPVIIIITVDMYMDGLSAFEVAVTASSSNNNNNNSVVLVLGRTIRTEKPPLISQVSAKFCG